MSEHRPANAGNDAAYPLEGWVGLMADKHRPDEQRGGCTCGFCAWSVEHVAVMAYRDAVDSAPVIPPGTEDGPA